MIEQSEKTNLIRRVAFFGDANIPETDPDYIDAYQTAKLLAENGMVIVNGGGPGIMDALRNCGSLWFRIRRP